jgi:hypothetical protein
MCRPLLTALSAIVVLATVGSLSPAVAARYCLQGRHWGHPGNCQFATYQQCKAAASGTGAFCGINPHYAFARQRSGRQ